MTAQRAITESTLGAWVFTANGVRWDVLGAIVAGERVESRCVADNYRSALMRRGQRAILWLSGPAAGRTPRGVWGLGWITGSPTADETGRLAVATDITLLDPADVLRATDVREVPELASIEVLRVPAQSNPSWVDVDQFAVLRDLLPRWPSRPR